MYAPTGFETASSSDEFVLIVDDDRRVCGLISRWLEAEGFRCREALSVEAAWQILRASDARTGLVTLDVDLPDAPGIELLSQIKKRLPDIEVLMLSGRAETQAAIDALTRGAFGYLLKPVQREELLFQVRAGFERRRMLVDRREYMQSLEDKVRDQTRAIRRAHEETIHRLVRASMYRDEETGAHIKRVGLYSEILARAIGWHADDVDCIRLAAPMHDVGKIGIPDAILQKPGRLTDAEFEIMKTHTLIGGEMLADSESQILHMARDIALSHHERWDGQGYPVGFAGEVIPEAARIVMIVDVYDALTHDRVYRDAMPEIEALGLISQGRGTHFDPRLLDVFLQVLPVMRKIAAEFPDPPKQGSAPRGLPEFTAAPIQVEPQASLVH